MRNPHVWRLLLTALVSVVLIGVAGAAPASAGRAKACKVHNRNTGRDYPKLAGAVRAARSGDRLTVRGLCRGGTVLKRRVAIKGVRNRRSGKPTLSGVGKSRVLSIRPGVKVQLRGVLVLRGKAPARIRRSTSLGTAAGLRGNGGGILNRGRLTLIDVDVRRSSAGRGGFGQGGGIYNTGTLILRGATRIRGNFAPAGGGVGNAGVMIMNGSSAIIGNGADDGGGGANSGRLTMNGQSRISRNGASADGGVANSGRLIMNDQSTIGGNTGGFDGGAGGVGNGPKATLMLNEGSSIRGNSSASPGGGVANDGGTVRLNDSAVIAANTAPACGGATSGGKGARFTMGDGSEISDNVASTTHGGGVCVEKGRFAMSGDSSTTRNSAVDKVDDAAGTYRGGGIYHSGGTLVGVSCGPQSLANVYLNIPDDCRLDAP